MTSRRLTVDEVVSCICVAFVSMEAAGSRTTSTPEGAAPDRGLLDRGGRGRVGSPCKPSDLCAMQERPPQRLPQSPVGRGMGRKDLDCVGAHVAAACGVQGLVVAAWEWAVESCAGDSSVAERAWRGEAPGAGVISAAWVIARRKRCHLGLFSCRDSFVKGRS